MQVGRIDREAPTLAAFGRRWGTYALQSHDHLAREAGGIATTPAQRVPPTSEAMASGFHAWNKATETQQAVALPFFFRPVAAFRASAMLAERAISHLDLKFPAAQSAKSAAAAQAVQAKAEVKSAAEPAKESPATTERSTESEAPATASSLAPAPLRIDGMGQSYEAVV